MTAATDRREHRRVHMQLPVRLRWTTPLGRKTEIWETLDVSRGGLLVPCSEAHEAGTMLWVTFPFDASTPEGQPEIPAKVTRPAQPYVAPARNGKKVGLSGAAGNGDEKETRVALALRFETAPQERENGSSSPLGIERRGNARRRLALPIRVRPANMPWFEEAMSEEMSVEGLRFWSSREYRKGDHLFIAFGAGGAEPWHGGGEFRTVVTRAEAVRGRSELNVAVRRWH